MQIAYVVEDAKKWEVDPAKTSSEFDPAYLKGCWRLLGGKQRLYSRDDE
jgi:hypothetical protein